MSDKSEKTMARKALQAVEEFFGRLNEEERVFLPRILESPGRWMANYTGSVLGIFFLSDIELKRVTEHHNNGWPPFPGFLIPDDLRPPDAPVAFGVGESCRFFASNHTSKMFAFSVKAGASFTVVDHFHEIVDSSTGREFKFRVDLAFVLGLHQGQRWSDLKPRLSKLLAYSVEAWKKLR